MFNYYQLYFVKQNEGCKVFTENWSHSEYQDKSNYFYSVLQQIYDLLLNRVKKHV